MSTKQTKQPIPKSIPFKWLVMLIIVFLIAIVLGVSLSKPIKTIVSKVTTSESHDDHDHEATSTQYFTCGMHPWIILPKPGDCPICFMKLTPLDPAKFTGEIAIDPIIVQNMGVRTATVTTGPLVQTINTVGTVDYNETLVRDINIKIAGWIEKLHVDYLGAKVKRGQTLFDLYAPELYAAQEEYLIAYRANGNADNQLLESSRTRLRYFDITDEQIAKLQKQDKPSKTLAMQSPYEGVVIAKHANEGMKVDPGMQVYRIADLSKIWVIVTLYEYQLPYIQTGNTATMSLPYIPGHTFEGTIVYIYPFLDKKTREVQVRLEFDNPDGLLKPGMFANVSLQNRLAKDRILAPREAVIDTGERKIAFVSLGNGRFEPRDIMTGIQTQNDRIEIVQGLADGDQVVTSGQFLLDSEAKIRAAIARMMHINTGKENASAMDDKPTIATITPAFADALNNVIKPYLAIGNELASDTIGQVPSQAQQLADAIATLIKQNVPGDEHFWHKHAQVQDAMHAASQLAKVSDISQARQQYASVSINLSQLLKETGVPANLGQTLTALHCPMFREDQGGSHWLQVDGDVRNPYFGSSMLRCFDTQNTMPLTKVGTDVTPASTQPTTQPASQDMQSMSHDPAAMLAILVDSYLDIQHALTNDSMEHVTDDLKTIKQTVDMLSKHAPDQLAPHVITLTSVLDFSTRDIKAVREGFEPLSNAMIELIKQADDSIKPTRDLYMAYCPMVKKLWIQGQKDIRNPFAPYMLDCGSIKEQIAKSGTTPMNEESEK